MGNSVHKVVSTFGLPCEPVEWLLPDDLLLKIFMHLDQRSLLRAGQVCTTWRRVAWDDTLWRRIAKATWPVADRPPEGRCWREEVQRFTSHVPKKLSEIIRSDQDGVTRLCVSPNGDYFSALSEDGFLTMWRIDAHCYIVRAMQVESMRRGLAMFSAFNEDGSLLMVTGTPLSSQTQDQQDHNSSIAVVYTAPELRFVTKVECFPHLMYGAWLGVDSFIVSAVGQTPETIDVKLFTIPAAPEQELSHEKHGRCLFTLPKFVHPDQSNLHAARLKQTDGKVRTYILFSAEFNTKLAIHEVTSQLSGTKTEADKDKAHVDPCPGRDAFITGLHLSADQRYVTIAYRDVHTEPEQEEKIFMPTMGVRIFDLLMMTHIGEVLTVHMATTARPMRHLWPYSTDQYIVSGTEELRGYMWDRHHHFLLVSHKYGGEMVINPRDEETCISVCDNKIRIWRSSNRMKSLGLATPRISVFEVKNKRKVKLRTTEARRQ